VCGEVHDCIHARQYAMKLALIADIAFDQFEALGQTAKTGGRLS